MLCLSAKSESLCFPIPALIIAEAVTTHQKMSIIINIILLIIIGIIVYYTQFRNKNSSDYFKSSQLKTKSKKLIEKNLDSAEIEQEFTNALKILEKFKREAYIPQTKKNENTFSTKSKIGGFPYLRNENDWPKCPNCKKNMQLFLQLNLKDLPKKIGEDIIQLFYCTNNDSLCESELEAYLPFSKAVKCRNIKIQGESASTEPVIDEIFDEKLIVDWTIENDYPHFEEYEKLGIKLNLFDEVYELMEERKIGLPLEKDKLFGWPYWIQAEEYPYDRKTGERMDLIFQLDSEDNLPYMFGDSGIGHLTKSPSDKNELAFNWACC